MDQRKGINWVDKKQIRLTRLMGEMVFQYVFSISVQYGYTQYIISKLLTDSTPDIAR